MFVVLLCLCYIIYIIWDKLLKEPDDSPPRLSFIETSKLFLQNTDVWTKFHSVCELTRDADGVGYGTLGLHRIYAVSNPEDSLTVLKSCAEKGFVYDLWKPWMGDAAIFTGPASITKVQRKLFLPTVSPRDLDSYVKHFDEHAHRFVSKMAARVDQPPFVILRDLLLHSLELFCTTLYGLPGMHKDNDFNRDVDPYFDSVASYLRLSVDKFMNPFYHVEFIYNRSKLKKEQDKNLKILHHISKGLIERRRKIYYEELKKRENGEHQASEVYIDILDEAVKKGIMTEERMREEIDTITFGGHDTMALTNLYSLVLLGSHPEVQEKVFEEVQDILGKKKDVNITKEDLSKMVYLEAAIKESMRLYPYAALIARRLDKDVKLRRRYAMQSMKTLLAHTVRNYRIRADRTKLQFEFVGVLEPKAGHEITLERRAQALV